MRRSSRCLRRVRPRRPRRRSPSSRRSASRQGRRLGTHAADARRQDARHGQGHPAGLPHGPGLGRWPHGHHGGEAGTRAMGIEYNPDMVTLAQGNAKKEGVATGHVPARRHLRERLLQGAGHHPVPAPVAEHEAAADAAEHAARHARRLEYVHDGGLDARRDPDRWRDCVSWCTALLWIVPAKVEGTWTCRAPAR